MSAYIVDDDHINALVTAAFSPGKYHSGPLKWFSWPHWYDTNPRTLTAGHERTAEQIGAMLATENDRSVAFRYRSDPEPSLTWEFKRRRIPLSAVEILKALACYEYQSCEHPDWTHSEAHQFCKSLRDRAIRELPGYDEADWGVKADAVSA